MLKRKNRCRHKDCTLFAVGNALERRSESNLCLTESDIAAKQSIHRVRLFHIVLDFLYTSELIIGLFIFKTTFKIILHINIG